MRIGLGLDLTQRLGGGADPGPSFFEFDFTGGALPDDVALERASVGTYLDDDGVLQSADVDVPRFDFIYRDGVWVLAGLLVEPQRTNHVLRTDWTSAWANTRINRAAPPDAVPAPDLSAGQSFHRSNTVNNLHNASVEGGGFARDRWTVSMCFRFAPAENLAQFRLEEYLQPHAISAVFNPGTRQVVSQGAEGDGILDVAMVEAFNEHWALGTLIGRPGRASSSIQVNIVFGSADAAGNLMYAGDASTTGIIAFGPQVEPGEFRTSLIYCQGSRTTRAADVMTLPLPDGVWELIAENEDGIYTGEVTVSSGAGYVFDWADLTGAVGQRHLQKLTAERIGG